MANQNQWEQVTREKLGRQALKLTLMCQEVVLKFVAGAAKYSKFPLQPVNASKSRLQKSQETFSLHCYRIKPVDYCDCIAAVVHA